MSKLDEEKTAGFAIETIGRKTRLEHERLLFQASFLSNTAPTLSLIELVERSWAAGFFDGEGHAGSSGLDHPIQSSPKITMEIVQGYEDLGIANLRRFQAAVGGAGSILGPFKNNPDSNPHYRWRASSESDIARSCDTILPFVGPAKYSQLRETVMLAPAVRHHRLEGKAERSSERDRKLRTVDTQPLPKKRGQYY